MIIESSNFKLDLVDGFIVLGLVGFSESYCRRIHSFRLADAALMNHVSQTIHLRLWDTGPQQLVKYLVIR